MSVLTQAFFPLVCRHFMSFSFFTAGHNNYQLRSLLFNHNCGFYFVDEGFGWFKRRNVVRRNDDRGVFGDVSSCFCCSFLNDKTSEAS